MRISPRFVAAFVLLMSFALLMASTAPAASGSIHPAATAVPAQIQDCGNWRDSVLCEVEWSAARQGERWERFDPNRDLELAPRSEIEIEMEGNDQFGRRFPRERIAIGFEDRDCDHILDVEDVGEGRLRIKATAGDGSCRLEIWVAGNLNFEWDVEVEIKAEARAGYSRAEAEMIANALYRAILGREADPGGLAGRIPEIQRGDLEGQVRSMLRSQEFMQSKEGVGANQLLDRFYQGIFGRPADSGAVSMYLEVVERLGYERVILSLLRSPEYEDMLSRVS